MDHPLVTDGIFHTSVLRLHVALIYTIADIKPALDMQHVNQIRTFDYTQLLIYTTDSR